MAMSSTWSLFEGNAVYATQTFAAGESVSGNAPALGPNDDILGAAFQAAPPPPPPDTAAAEGALVAAGIQLTQEELDLIRRSFPFGSTPSVAEIASLVNDIRGDNGGELITPGQVQDAEIALEILTDPENADLPPEDLVVILNEAGVTGATTTTIQNGQELTVIRQGEQQTGQSPPPNLGPINTVISTDYGDTETNPPEPLPPTIIQTIRQVIDQLIGVGFLDEDEVDEIVDLLVEEGLVDEDSAEFLLLKSVECGEFPALRALSLSTVMLAA